MPDHEYASLRSTEAPVASLQEAQSASPEALRRFSNITLVAAIGWGFNALVYLLLHIWVTGIIELAVIAATLILRQWVLAHRTARHLLLGNQLGILLTFVGLVIVSLRNGQNDALAVWYLVAMPMVAAYLIGRRAALWWMGVCALAVLGIWGSGFLFTIPSDFVSTDAHLVFARLVIMTCCLAFGLAARDASDKYIERLQLAREAAEAASRAKSDFLTTMSHEIRTPLNGVIGLNTLLLDTELNAQQRQYVELSRLSGETLLHLINDILDLSKIEAGRLELEPLPFDPREVGNSAIHLLQEKARGKGLELQADFDFDVPEGLRGDPARLRQILVNLLGNAVKFTESGSVRLSCHVAKQRYRKVWLRYEVQDTGPGILPDVLARLFQPFTQADVSTTRQYGGSGLGLSISRRLAEVMGGELDVQTVPGQGSTFWLEIPFDTLARGEQLRSSQSTFQQAESQSADVRGHVLVAEDNSVNQLVASEALKRLGYHVDIVGNGREAVEAVRHRPYDLIFLDCHMPVMDGFEACRAIRANEAAGQKIPIIAMTASALKGDREKCLEAGMDDYLPKPVRLNDLRAALERWVAPA
ncbi:MAG: ATP-binding protein [Pedobacter sp.]|nr:ATP-binding protein [Pedobacter sp.]